MFSSLVFRLVRMLKMAASTRTHVARMEKDCSTKKEDGSSKREDGPGVEGDGPRLEEDGPSKGEDVPGTRAKMDLYVRQVGPGCQRPGSIVSSQLLYSDSFAECYQENKLTVVGKGSSTFVKGQLETVDVPPSSILSRIKSFLPELSMANEKMALELVNNPCSVDRFNIEHLGEEGDGRHVEMNLSLVPPELLAEDDSGTDESESESETESESEQLHQENLQELRRAVSLHLASSKCARPGIEVLEDVQPASQEIMDR